MSLMLAVYALLALKHPRGSWDALAIWNLQAKYIASGTLRVPPNAFHPDYPPLLALVIGGIWRVIGSTPLVPQLVHGAIFGALLWALRDAWWALVMVGLIGLQYAPTQCADTLIALWLVWAVRRWEHKRYVQTGLILTLALFTKHEGLIIAMVFLLLPGRKQIVLGLIPGVLLLVVYKLYLRYPSDMQAPYWGGVVDVTRWREVVPQLAQGWIDFGHYAWIVLGLIILVNRAEIAATPPTYVCGVVLGLYGAIYLITPHDPVTHIATSWDRLIWQITPATLASMIKE